MNILILGGGGREHALADKVAAGKLCTGLYIAPGNAGTALLGKNVDIRPGDFGAVKAFVLEKAIDLVIVGPEAPLVAGISDLIYRLSGLLPPGRVLKEVKSLPSSLWRATGYRQRRTGRSAALIWNLR
jgi:hypothetical protein